MKNKTSVWSIIILIASIISLILLVSEIIVVTVGMPAVQEAARQAAADQGLTQQEIDLAVSVAVGAVIGGLVAGCIFDVFKIIGGFLFSLKGRWGVFCIVVAILGAIGSVVSLINGITNKAGAGTIVTNVISIAIDVLLIVACFKHRAENR
ncbi:MAG: hypothetical protein J6O18_09340 [Bacilli bacterium]|nr:hypothetical protein [Bacilli bacterium]